MASINKLKKGKAASKPANKGEPPAPTETTENLKQIPREISEGKRNLNLSIFESIADEFDQEAYQRFGFKKGAKSDMFVALWKEYQARKA